MLANIAEVAANIGNFLKSPIVAPKREILRLILSDCKTEGKNIAFSITKPFDELLKTPEINKWCRWQACAPAGARRSRKASLRSLSLAELRPARSPHLLRNSVLSKVTIKKPSVKEGFLMVPLARIGLATPSLPMTCSTTELQRQNIRLCRSRGNIQNHFSKCKHIFLIYKLFL